MSEENNIKIDPNNLKDGLIKIAANLKKEAVDNFKTINDENKGTFEAFEAKTDKKLGEWKAEVLKTQTERKSGALDGLTEELDTMEKKGLDGFRFSEVIKAQIDGKWSDDAGFEQEVIKNYLLTDEGKKKSNNGQTGAAGGYLIPEEVTGRLIDLAFAKTPLMEMGVTKLNGLRGIVPIPKITGRQTITWVGEEEAPTESNVTFGEIELRPRIASCLSKVSKHLLWQTSGTAEAIVKRQMIKAFALGLEDAFLNSLGSEKKPKGLRNFDGLTTTTEIGATGGRFRIDKANEMATNIDVANMLDGNLGYLMRPEVLSGLLTERVDQYSAQPSGEGQPISSSQIILSRAALEETLNGWKIRTTTILPNDTVKTSTTLSPVIFGDFSQMIIGVWEGFEMRASDIAGDATGSAFNQQQVWINAFQSVDTNIEDATGITKIEDAETLRSAW